MRVEVKILNNMIGNEIDLPDYQTAGSAGFDLRACIHEDFVLKAKSQHLFGTGLAIKVADPNFAGFILSRSGLSLKNKVRVAQGVGTIDSDYPNEVGVILENYGDADFLITKGMRIAQFVVQPVVIAELTYVTEFTSKPTDRLGGFGSTGTS